jgi:hypothetical protein
MHTRCMNIAACVSPTSAGEIEICRMSANVRLRERQRQAIQSKRDFLALRLSLEGAWAVPKFLDAQLPVGASFLSLPFPGGGFSAVPVESLATTIYAYLRLSFLQNQSPLVPSPSVYLFRFFLPNPRTLGLRTGLFSSNFTLFRPFVTRLPFTHFTTTH